MKEPLNGLSILEELDLKFGSAKNKQQIIHALEHSTILHRIPLPAPNVTTEQAQKDFRRERVLLNDVPFIPDKFDTDRCHAFSFTLQVLLERMMRQTQIYNQDLYSSSAVITDLIMQRACRTSAGADSFFTVQKLLCVEGTFVTQRAFLIDPPIKIDVFIADPEPDEVNGIPLVAVGEVVKTSNEFNNEPETKLQLHHPLKTLNNVNNTDNNSSSIINSSNNSTRSDSPKSHSNADNKNQKNSNSSSRSNLFSTATRITSNSRPFSTSDVSSSSSNNNITNCTLVSSTTPSQIVLSSSTASSPSIDASSSSPGCSSMVIPPDNIATTITAPVPVIGEGSSEARNSLLIHTPSIDEWSANTEVMYCNHKDENTDKPQHHHQQQQQSYQNEHTETDGCAHRQNNNMEFNSTMCSSSDSYITLVDSTTNYPIPLKDNNNNSSINTITASNDSTNKPINDCRPSMIHNSNSSSNAGSNNKPIITSIRGATLSCHPAPLPKTPQLPPPLPTVASSSSYSNNNNINSSMTNSSDGTNAGRRKVYSNPTPATTNALLSSSSMKGLSTTGSTSLKSIGTCSSNKITTTTTTVPTTTKARELLLSPSPASSSKVPAVLAYANNTTCGAICSRIQVMNSFAIYDVSAIEQITGIAADDPPAWLEVEAIVVDESNFFTGKHWRKLQLVVTCQATGKVYTSSGDASVAKRVSGRLSGRMILQELSSWFITATTSGNNNNNSNHNNNNITTTTTTTGIGAYNNHHIKKTYSNVSALPDGSDGNNNTTSNMNNNNNNKHIPVPSSPPINNSNNNNSSSSIMNSSPPPHHHHHSHRLGIMRRVYTGIQDATGLRNSSSNNSSNNTSNLSLKNNVHNNSNCNIICNDTHNNNSNSSISNKGCNQDSENNMHDMNMKNGSRYNEDDGEVEEDKIRPYSSSTNRTRTLTATPTSSGIFTCSTPPPLPSLSSSAAMTIPVLPALPLSPSSSTAATNAADALANTPTIVESVSVFTTNGCGDDVGDENIIYGASSSSIVSCPYSLHSTNTPSSSSSLALSNSFDTQLQLAATLPHQKLLLPVLSSSATTTSFVATGQPDTTTTNSHNLLATTSSNNDNANVTTTSPILSQLAHVIVQNDLLPHQSIKSTISSASSNYTTNTSTAAAVVNKISDDEEEDELLSEIASISSESL